MITIHATVDAIWRIISDFGAVSRYLAMVTQCTAHGRGMGALRTLTYMDGSVMVERLEMVNEASHLLSYILLTDTPFGGCLTTMALRDLRLGQTELSWFVTFKPTGLPKVEAVSLIESMLVTNCQMLKWLLDAEPG